MTPGRKQFFSRLLLTGLAGVTAFASIQLVNGHMPVMISGGLLLCALAPMAFVLFTPRTGDNQHPVLVSALIALGCVMIMVGIQRFGEAHEPMLVLAVAVLATWMLFQRKVWRA